MSGGEVLGLARVSGREGLGACSSERCGGMRSSRFGWVFRK